MSITDSSKDGRDSRDSEDDNGGGGEMGLSIESIDPAHSSRRPAEDVLSEKEREWC